MKLVKMFGLTAAFAFAAMAFAGAGSAVAVSQVVGCLGTLEIKEGQMKCVGEYDLKSNVQISGGASESKFDGGLGQACGESNVAMNLTTGKEAGSEGMLAVNGLVFSGSCKPCSTVEATGLPYSKGTVVMPSEAEDDFSFETGAIGLALSGCPMGITCKFAAKNAKLKYVVSKGFTSNELRAEGVALEKVGGSEFCGSTAKWSANYVTTVPVEWWLGLM